MNYNSTTQQYQNFDITTVTNFWHCNAK